MAKTYETALFGGGCFWCTEAIFSQLKGVSSVTAGYMGGTKEHPTYEDVCSGKTGYIEVIRIEFDPNVIPYSDLLDIFWHTHDPTSRDRQGADAGVQYRSVIFYTSEEQKRMAEESRDALNKSKEFSIPIVTGIQPQMTFYEAEGYHQQYFRKNSNLPYCQLIISPKLAHLREKYSSKFKK